MTGVEEKGHHVADATYGRRASTNLAEARVWEGGGSFQTQLAASKSKQDENKNWSDPSPWMMAATTGGAPPITTGDLGEFIGAGVLPFVVTNGRVKFFLGGSSFPLSHFNFVLTLS